MFFFSSRRRHTRYIGDWSSDVCSSDLAQRRRLAREVALLRDLPVVERGAAFGDPRGELHDYGHFLVPGACKREWKRVDRVRSEERRVGKEWSAGMAAASYNRRAYTSSL